MGPSVGFWGFVWMCLGAAKDATLARLKWDAQAVITGAILLLVGYLLFRWRRGKKVAKDRAWEEFLWGIAPLAIFAICLFVFNCFRSPHLVYQAEHEKAQQLIQQADTHAKQAEHDKETLSEELRQEKDKSQPKFEIVTAVTVFGEGNLQENGRKKYFSNAYLQVGVLNHGAPSVIKDWKEFVRLTNGTVLEGHLLIGDEKHIHMSTNGPRGRTELPIYPSLVSTWSVTPIPTGGRGVGSVIFIFPLGTKAQVEGPGGAIILKLWDIGGKEYVAEVPWQAVKSDQEIYTLPGMGRN
jgi:hypothetical protein